MITVSLHVGGSSTDLADGWRRRDASLPNNASLHAYPLLLHDGHNHRHDHNHNDHANSDARDVEHARPVYASSSNI